MSNVMTTVSFTCGVTESDIIAIKKQSVIFVIFVSGVLLSPCLTFLRYNNYSSYCIFAEVSKTWFKLENEINSQLQTMSSFWKKKPSFY